VKASPKGTKRLAAEEPLPFTGRDEANFIDGVISTCYKACRVVRAGNQDRPGNKMCSPRNPERNSWQGVRSGMEYKGFDLYSPSANSGWAISSRFKSSSQVQVSSPIQLQWYLTLKS